MKPGHLVWLRRISQTVFLLLFLFLLVQSRLPQEIFFDYTQSMGDAQDIRIHQPVTFFFQLDPLVWITSLISGHTWIKGVGWALLVLVLTVLLGRVFCGFICPFGTIHNMVSYFRPGLKGNRLIHANRSSPALRIKYFILFGVLTTSLFGLNLAGLMDPMSCLFRSLALALFPGIGNSLTGLFGYFAASDIHFLKMLSYGEQLFWPVFGFDFKLFQSGWLIGVIFLTIIFLNRIKPRFWCRTLCPLGALLGVCSGFSLLRLEQKEEACTHCRQCVKTCQGAAEPEPGTTWNSAECLMCFNCFAACPESAVRFTFRRRAHARRLPDMGRRAVIGGLTAGISLSVFGTLDGRVHGTSNAGLVRPPGSLAESEFLTLCQRCGLCMKACPTNVINPALTEAGMAGFWTPTLRMTQGYCEHTCTICGSVCPTGAIAEITSIEKTETPIRIGSAHLDRGRCLPWSGNGPCIVCEEHCPTSPKAIYLIENRVEDPRNTLTPVKLPQIDLKQCTGCGICENKCPVKGKPAIRVIAAGESRSLTNRILL